MTEGDLDNFIRSKFYDMDISRITIPKKGIDFEILVEVSKETETSQMEKMRKFLSDVDLGTDKITVKYKIREYNDLLFEVSKTQSNNHGVIPEKQSVEDIYLLDKISSVAILK